METVTEAGHGFIPLYTAFCQAYTRLLQFPARTGLPAHLIFYEDLKRSPEAALAALHRFLGLPPPPPPPGGLAVLEPLASDRPAIKYLRNLTGLQAALGGEEWGDMLLDPGYDAAVDAAAAFAEACRLHPAARMSWRQHACADGVLRPAGSEGGGGGGGAEEGGAGPPGDGGARLGGE